MVERLELRRWHLVRLFLNPQPNFLHLLLPLPLCFKSDSLHLLIVKLPLENGIPDLLVGGVSGIDVGVAAAGLCGGHDGSGGA